MALSEPLYFVFLFVAATLFYLLPEGIPRRALLISASYYFYYSLSHAYVAILLLTTAFAFFGGLALRSDKSKQRKGFLFALAIIAVLTPLLVFKYAPFLLNLSAQVFSFFHPISAPGLSWVLPVGISFFTFAAVGYLIDVYLGVIESESRPLYFGLFLAFFPLVSAGPIERAGRLIPQFDCIEVFSSRNALGALRLIFWGLVLKILFADQLSAQINPFFSNPDSTGSLEKLCAMIQYVYYLYSDFAGYSLIAIGSAKLLGFEVLRNFQQPFLSSTVPEFWRNWHISLSSWVRDYLFSPLRAQWRRYKNRGMAAALIISFLILGFWHGAAWGFLIFGALHGLLVTLSTFTLARRNIFWANHTGRLSRSLHFTRVLTTFFAVTLTFVVFRANSIHDALLIYHGLFSYGILKDIAQLFGSCFFDFVPRPEFHFIKDPYNWALIALIIIGDILVRRKMALETFPSVLQFIVYNAGVGLILYIWLSGNVAAPFLYYKF